MGMRARAHLRPTRPTVVTYQLVAPTPEPDANPGGGGGPYWSAPVRVYPRNGFVYRYGTQLYVDGQLFHFTGLNIYNANNTGYCWYYMGGGSDLDGSLSNIGPGQSVFRAWFFQRLVSTPGGGWNWSAFDHTLAVARAHGERVIATLGNQWGDCEEQPPVYKTESWYQSGYRSRLDGLPGSYRDFVAAVVSRYRNNNTIMAWQLINEAEDLTSQGGWCSGSAASSLRAFAWDMANVVKSIDGSHLLSLGTIGGGQCGTAGGQYQWVHSVPGIDLCEYHDYGYPGTTLPGGLLYRINQCRALGKPLFVGETGIQFGTVGSVQARAADFAAKFRAQFWAGVVGELVWDWVDGAHTAYSGYEVGPGDPTLTIFGRY